MKKLSNGKKLASIASSTKTSKPKIAKKTITALVLALFRKDPTIKSKAMIEKVKAEFPKSAFQLSHYSWFKYQIKNKKYPMPSNIVEALKA